MDLLMNSRQITIKFYTEMMIMILAKLSSNSPLFNFVLHPDYKLQLYNFI